MTRRRNNFDILALLTLIVMTLAWFFGDDIYGRWREIKDNHRITQLEAELSRLTAENNWNWQQSSAYQKEIARMQAEFDKLPAFIEREVKSQNEPVINAIKEKDQQIKDSFAK